MTTNTRAGASILLLVVAGLLAGCSFFRGFGQGIAGTSPVQAEVEKALSELLAAEKEYERLVNEYEAAKKDGSIGGDKLKALLLAGEKAAAAFKDGKARLASLMEQKRLIEQKQAESGTDWGHTAGSALAGALLLFLGQKAGRNRKMASLLAAVNIFRKRV